MQKYEVKFKQESENLTNSYSGKAEYKHQFDNKQTLTSGCEFYYAFLRSDFIYNDLINGQYLPDLTKNNSFEHKETFMSTYISYSWKLNDKLGGMLGVRLENINRNGNQKLTRDKTHKNYLNILPSLSFMYTINTKHKISYNFSHGVNIPPFYTLNNFKFFLNPTTYKEYNPNLKASKTYNNRLLYTLNNRYILGLNYRYISQCRNNFMVPVDDKYTKSINTNYGNLHLLGLNMNWNDSFFDDYLYIKMAVSGNYRKERGGVESITINNSTFSYRLSANVNCVISKKHKWNGSLSCSYTSQSNLTGYKKNGGTNMSVELKKIFPKDISLNFGISGLLRTRSKSSFINDSYRYHNESNIYYKTAYFTLSVPFGNQKTKGAHNRESSSSTVNSRLSE